MTDIKPKKMMAPKGTSSANIQGHPYTVAKDGTITLAVEAHREDLYRHGFTDHEEKVTAEDVADMDKDQLIEFIEENGEECDADDKPKNLRKQALRLVKD